MVRLDRRGLNPAPPARFPQAPAACPCPLPLRSTSLHSALFLDLDGTLFDLMPRPEDVHGDAQSAALLAGLDRDLGGRLAC
jgi:hypothetical protein